jgi:hypothetical protein
VTREHPVPVTLQVLRAVLAKDVGDGAHEDARLERVA